MAVGVLGWATDRLDAVQTRWEDALQPGVGLSDDPPIVVVGFDRSTLAALGSSWPIERSVHADLVAAVAAGGPSVIVYDVLFADTREGDADLVAALESTTSVIATAVTLTVDENGVPRAVDRVQPEASLSRAAVTVGHANVTLAPDTGVVHGLPAVVLDDRGVPLPSLALAAAAVSDGSSPVPVQRADGYQIGRRFVPTNNHQLAINWSGELSSDDVVPAIDVLAGSVASTMFTDAIVIVGVTEPTLGDQHLVPTDRSGSTSGVLVIANAINTIVSNGYLYEPAGWQEFAVIATMGLVIALAFARLRLSGALIVTLLFCAAGVVGAAWRFHASGEQWNVVWPVITAVLVGAVLSAWRYVGEIRHRRHAWRLFATYVPASVVDELADPRRLASASQSVRREITVLFCDLRGFTPIAAGLDPDEVRRLLERYYDYAVGIIHERGGTVMQFVGDEVFAVFGAPIERCDAPTTALETAVALQDGRHALDAMLTDIELPSVRFGIGVHTGMATVAHVGPEDRLQYSAIGDTVNVGSRLCGLAAAGEIVVSDSVKKRAGDALTAGPMVAETAQVKGIDAPLPIWRRLSRAEAGQENGT